MRVLYDGWALVHQPDSPAALHLLALLASLGDGVQPLLALPGEAPAWLAENVKGISASASSSVRGRLAWEQRILPRLAREHGADLTHLVTHTPPLFGSRPSVVSPAGMPAEQPGGGFWSRLREALAQGGMSRLRGLLWPEDLRAAAPADLAAKTIFLPPVLYPGFFETMGEPPQLELPETFILYHGSCEPRSLLRLLDAWGWVAGPVGEYYPLLLLGADEAGRRAFETLSAMRDFGSSVRLLPPLEPAHVPAVYRACSAIFHPAPVYPWENPLRAGLVLGKPLVSIENPLAAELCGPAAYLVDGENARTLGAALLTVVVEDSVREGLEQAARQRAAGWQLAQRSLEFREKLLEIYSLAGKAG